MYNWDRESCPLYGVERLLRNRGFLSTILNGDTVRTKVSVHHRQGGRESEVVIKRGTCTFCKTVRCTFRENHGQSMRVGMLVFVLVIINI